MYPLKFKPVYKNYIWGGRGLEKIGKILPQNEIVAESWEISVHSDGPSMISNGEHKGILLTEYLKLHGVNAIGSLLEDRITDFPLLVKFIDANENLSVQVHPDDKYAYENENGSYGKNEMWYILYAQKDAFVYCELKEGTDKVQLEKGITDGSVEELLEKVYVNEGDVIDIPAGIVHAIGKGIILAEVQQNSNSTYRVFDYNRLENGIARPLHVKKALDVIKFTDKKTTGKLIPAFSPCDKAIQASVAKTVSNKYFDVEIIRTDASSEYKCSCHLSEPLYYGELDGSFFEILILLNGNATIKYKNGSIEALMGESLFLPASLGKYFVTGSFTMMKVRPAVRQ